MIGVAEAKRIMMEHVELLGEEFHPLAEASGHYLSYDALVSQVDHPPFDCSAVDGYAFRYDGRSDFRVVMRVAAGDAQELVLGEGECVRIFTGARLPRSADTVVMQEHVTSIGDRITHRDTRCVRGANVRRRGEQLRMGEIVLQRGSRFTPPVIGLLASAGYSKVTAAPFPTVEVIVSGNEFAEGPSLDPGRIFSSNDHMLLSALRAENAVANAMRATDDRDALAVAISTGLERCNVLVTTGGVSVGDHDLIRPTLEDLGATIHFHGVSQKPGKPMLFATLNGKPIFGLPGNPRAVMVLFWEYVLPFLRAMQGAEEPWLRADQLPLSHALEVKGDRAEFRAVQVRGGKVTLLRDEGSHMLRSLIDADALAYLPADRRSWAEGDPVEVHYIPQ